MTIPFNQLVSAIACAVVDAQHQVRKAHISELYNHFNQEGRPVSVKLQIPRWDRETGDLTPSYFPVNVPLMILTNPSQLSIQDMQVTMQVDMREIARAAMEDNSRQSYEWKQSEYRTLIGTSTTTGKKSGEIGMAQVTLKVTAEEIPEGLARLLDHLNKCL